MSELTPITRVESYLDAIVNSGIPPTEDITRIETFLQAIYDNQVCALTPITRIEMFLGKISGQDIVLPEPITRIELYLAAIAGEDVELPENPITRLEMYLAEWADSGDWTTISGAIVEFITQRAHKLKSCVVNLSPKQDLHGYDNPWPAGGGKNLIDYLSCTGIGVRNGTDTDDYPNDHSISGNVLTISLSYAQNGAVLKGVHYPKLVEGQTVTISGRFRCSGTKIVLGVARYTGGSGNQVDTGVSIAANTWETISRTFTLTETFDQTVLFVQPQAGGTVLEIENLQLESGSAATTFAPYENICPISGHTGVTVWDTGTNVCTKTIRGYLNVGSQIITIDGNAESAVFYAKKGETYTISHSTAATRNSLALVGTENIVSGTPYTETATYNLSINTWTATWEGWTVWYRIPSLDQDFENTAQIQIGSTATDYEAFRGNSYSVTWEDEVYGATPDIVSGEMPVTMRYIVIDGNSDIGKESTGWAGNYEAFYLLINPYRGKNVGPSVTANIVTNQLKATSYQGLRTGTNPFVITFTDSAKYLEWGSTSTTLEEEKSRLAENPIQIAYELETPILTTITPTPVNALQGLNNVWSDAGEVTVTFRGTPIEEPDAEPLQALNLLLGGAYRNDQTPEDVPDDEALDILLGGGDR